MLILPGKTLSWAPAGGGGLSVLSHTSRISDGTDNVTQYTSSAFTAQTGSNRMMLIAVGSWTPAASTDTTVSSITYGAQGATEVVNFNTTPAFVGMALYRIMDADIPSGSNTLTVNWSHNQRSCTAIVLELAGVDQTTPLPTVGSIQSGSTFDGGGGEALTITTANANSYLVTAFSHQQGEASPTLACTEGTEVVVATGTGGSTDNTGGLAYELIPTAGSETHTWTSSLTTRDWAGVAVEVKAA